ncbi:MAG: OapA family protein [Pontibacterium sp.]
MIHNELTRIFHSFPRIHLMAASLCTLIVGLTLLLTPAKNPSAQVNELKTKPLPLPETAVSDTPLPLPESKLRLPDNTTFSAPLLPNTAVEVKQTAEPAPKEAVNTDTSTETALTIEPVAAQPERPKNRWLNFKVKSGDTLSQIFENAGFGPRDVYSVSNAARHSKGLSLRPGQTIAFEITPNDELQTVKLIRSELVTTWVERTPEGFVAKVVERKPDIQHRFASATINSSLFVDGEKAGLTNKKIMELAEIFGWDIDFVKDIRKGDQFSLIYEERYLDGDMIGEGAIVAAQFINQGREVTALRYTDSEGRSSYYTPSGKSMRKAFLRSPVDFARISSGFSLTRRHPVLNTIRAHKGTDYAARTGTPIKASGDGRIAFQGTKGGYGRTVILQHGGNITTLYAHMSRYRKGLKTGSRVTQGQVIGYVGQSGLATGPHLHYEFRLNGVHRNPMTVKFPHASPVPKKERAAFNALSQTLMAQLTTYQATQVAMADQ